MARQSSTALVVMDDPTVVMAEALKSKAGVTIEFRTSADAVDYRQRCYAVRQMIRNESKRIYEVGTEEYAASKFDKLVFKIARENSRCLTILPASAEAFGIISVTDTATGKNI